MTTALQYVSASALSLTLSGNTGIGPFLTLFVVGAVEKYDPTLLHMDGWVEQILASWPGLAAFGVLMVLEFVGKCVPVVDEVIDGALVFVMPLLSALGSSASFGLFAPEGEDAPEEDAPGRRLEGEEESSVFLTCLKIVLVGMGIGLSLLVHLGKMLVRLMGEGCCTPCITVAEEVWVVVSVTLCIVFVPIAIGAALVLLVTAGMGFRSWWKKRQEKRDAAAAGATATTATAEGTGGTKSKDEEEGKAEATQSTGAPSAPKEELQEPLLP